MNKSEVSKHLEAMKKDLSSLLLGIEKTERTLSQLRTDDDTPVTDMPLDACKATGESLTHTSWHVVDIDEDITQKLKEQEAGQKTVLQDMLDDTRKLLERYERESAHAQDIIALEVVYSDTFYQQLSTIQVTLAELMKEEN